MKIFINFHFILFILIFPIIYTFAEKEENSKKHNSSHNENDIKKKVNPNSNYDQYYIIYVNKTLNNDVLSHKKHTKRENEIIGGEIADIMVDKIQTLILDNIDTYENPEEILEIHEDDKSLKKRNEEEYLMDYGDSSLVYPISSTDDTVVLYALLSDDVKAIIEQYPNVISCNEDQQSVHEETYYNEKNILEHSNWSSLLVQENAPLHLSLISQGFYDEKVIKEYDDNYYYPSSSGEGVNIIILDGGFNFNNEEFDNTDERIAKCVAIVEGGKVKVPENSKFCKGSESSDHGIVVSISAAGKIRGVAKKSNIFGIVLDKYTDANFISAYEYIRLNIKKPHKTIINLSFGGYDKLNKLEWSNNNKYESRLINNIVYNGAIIFASAGNGKREAIDLYNKKDLHIPSSFENVISVGSIETTNTESLFNGYRYNLLNISNYGLGVDIYAPGVVEFIYNNINNTLSHIISNGTSLSSPIAAGVAATIISERKDILFDAKIMLNYLKKTGIHSIIDGIPSGNPNIFINNGKNIVYSKNNEYNKNKCGIQAGLKSCGSNQCCTLHGECVNSTDHQCSTKVGCQTEMGNCKIELGSFDSLSNQYKCGIGIGSCPEGYCCSSDGYCGKTSQYCNLGCQINYGICNKESISPSLNSSHSWIKYDGTIPDNAVSMKNSNGNTIAVCPVNYMSGVHPGYVDETTKLCYISYGGLAYEFSKFEILIGDMTKLRWISWDTYKIFNPNYFKYIEGGHEVIDNSDKINNFISNLSDYK